jgi:drug/metabolite transporter (DMT)-like permease
LAIPIHTIAPNIWMVCGCFFLAWMGQFAHLLQGACDWRVVALVRAGLAFLFAVGLAKFTGAKLAFLRPGALWVRGCASSISLLCTFFAFTALPTSEVLTLTNTFPIWVAFLSWPLLHVRPSHAAWCAAGVGVVGVALIQSPHLEVNGNGLHAVMISLGAALTNAIAMLGLHRLKGLHPWTIVAHYSGVATVFVLGTCLVGQPPDFSSVIEIKTVCLLTAVGVSATLGQLCVTQAFTHGQPTRISVVALLQVVFALILDLLISGSTLLPVTALGITLVFAPTVWMMLGGLVSRSHKPSDEPFAAGEGVQHVGRSESVSSEAAELVKSKTLRPLARDVLSARRTE